MAIAWSRISSKVITTPLYADATCSRRRGNGQIHSGAFIPQMGEKRKQEVLGARDAEVTLCAQTRGGMCHECVDRLPPAETFTKHRSTSCPQTNDPRKHTPKPDSAAASQRTSALHAIAARRNRLL